MDAVVLAAGAGTRFRRTAASCPKPLHRLFGVSLVERALRAARQAGCRRVLVVTGYQAEAVERAVLQAGRPWVEVVRAEGWERGNGASLLAVRGRVDGPFLLLMADHLVDPGLVRQALAAARARWDELVDGGVLLLVDPRLDQVFDLPEATKVRTGGGGCRIEAIGKDLATFDAVDTGIFVASPALLDELARLAAGSEAAAPVVPGAGPPAGSQDRPENPSPPAGTETITLTAAAGRLARRGRLGAVPVTRGWWIDVDDGAALAHARRLLLDHAAASGGDGPVARWLNRRLSRPLSAWLASAGVGPNGATLLAFATTLAGALAFAAGQPWLGGLLCQAGSVLDGCDGEVARLRLEAQPRGAFLDTVLDRYADAAVVAGLAAGALAAGAGGGVTLTLALAAMAGMPLSALMKDRLQLLRPATGQGAGAAEAAGGPRTGQPEDGSPGTRRFDPMRDDPPWLRWIPGNRDGRYFLICLAGLAAAPLAGLAAVALVSHVLAVGRLLHGWRALALRQE
ncbi:NTP transferase domain-containing protein [Thermaerobacter subterraneus]|uniref:Bifunctional IPC transferase and DIPP synthase n=1 Tax=Thermaerobacter subterraneus DSM 13965 TaxID=867903 RepID=K6PP54_9FIRM|nr:NTP transferase domain-containing protein [Thermaerobacter subterraneus]EKP94692.1 putative sugar nucleotidyltransferase [Thermaerobacter subterraneus DSM 13965]